MSRPVTLFSYTGAALRPTSRGGMRRLSLSLMREISSTAGVSGGSSNVIAARRKLGPMMLKSRLAPIGLDS